MAGQRGILGVKKDPKKQILFSFKTREGEEWPSDDSEDSDYMPDSDEDTKPTKKRKIKMTITKKQNETKTSPGHKKLKTVNGGLRKSVNDEHCANTLWTDLPPELLLKILQYITDEEGAVPFLPRISRVCMAWAEISRHPALWKKVDLSYGWVKTEERTLSYLCKHRFSRLKELNLSSWKNLTDVGLETIADHCPLLENLDISHCSKVKGAGIQNLVTKCRHVSRLNMSFLNTDAAKPQTIKVMLEKCGPSLRSLEMAGNKYTGFNGVLSIFQNANSEGAHCHRLEVLDVSNCWFSTDFMLLNLEKLQRGLPNLTVLRLANSKFRASAASARIQAESPGFPKLEELSVAISTDSANGGIGIDDIFIFRLLKSSVGMRLLDFRGTTHVTTRGLQALPITSLEQLYLSQSAVSRHPGLHLIMHKWRHSLKILDLSWNSFPGEELDEAMETLAAQPDICPLETINLSGTSISAARVKSLLRGCPKLTSLNLSSCRGLPRGMKRDYSGKLMDGLRKEIDKIQEDDS